MNDFHPEIPHTTSTAPPPVLVAQLYLLTTLALFFALAISVTLDKTQSFDQNVLLALRDASDMAQPIGPAWMLEVMRTFTAIGTGLSLTAIVLLGLAWLFFRGDRFSIAMFTIASVGGFVLNILLKIGMNRPRPSIVPLLSEIDPWSFPSGHAMMTMAIFLCLAVLIGRSIRSKRIRNLLRISAVMLSLIIGLSRMYLGVHYPSDVVAGWLLGLAWASACWLIGWKYHQWRSRARV
ncbi:MAG: phosphatase PAP2 family protein [Bacteroidota bacterium]